MTINELIENGIALRGTIRVEDPSGVDFYRGSADWYEPRPENWASVYDIISLDGGFGGDLVIKVTS